MSPELHGNTGATEIVTGGHYIVNISVIIILFIFLFLLSWGINRFILKKQRKTIFIAIAIWAIILVVNIFSTLVDIPLILGINTSSGFDGGINGTYISLGYAIEVEGHNLLGNSDYNIYFKNIFK